MQVGTWLAVAVVVVAPLAAGTVHRAPLITIMAATAVAVGLVAWGTAAQHRLLRTQWLIVVPLLFLILPVLQSVPLPMAMRRLLDPKGTQLLMEAALVPLSSAPLSLDPPSTRSHIGRAAVALAIFLLAYHLASGQRRRHLLLRAIGITAAAAVVIGAGHRIFGVSKIYGVLVSTHRTLLTGPFVNSNHTAELLELGAFVCLACSFQRPTALNRIGWLIGMLFCFGGAAATLSRGAVAAVGAGVLLFVLLRYLARDEAGPHRRVALAWGAFLIGLIGLGAGSLGVRELIHRFQPGALTSDVRFALWRDSLRVLSAHPFGIGRGAFDRVYPIYRTLKTSLSIRFAFVENHPLQLLIDGGWVFFALLLTGVGCIVWQIARRSRRDKTEAALLAGLAAVGVHSLFDFGLETLGVLLPFVAVLATILGRLRPEDDTGAAKRVLAAARSWPIVGVAGVGLVIGIASLAHASSDDFDALLKAANTPEARREVLVRGQVAHPVDYFFPLVFARQEPLKSGRGGPSPRFHALNRALMLCPGCDSVHLEVARNLWRLGSRRQALLEWRTAVSIQPQLFAGALGELFAAGASPQELASIGTFDAARMVDIAAFLSSIARVDDAFVVLDQAEAMGAPVVEVLLMRAKLQLQAGRTDAAAATLARVHAVQVLDPRLALLEAQMLIDTKGADAGDAALATLDEAATRYPVDLAVQRMRLDVVMKYEKWQAADRALDGLKQALYLAQGSALEAHIASARLYARLSRWTNALGEYRIALADARSDVALWMEFGHAAEVSGRATTAREAYGEASRLNPTNPEVVKALSGVDAELSRLRSPAR